MTIDPVQVAAYVTAGALAATKLFSAFQPLWQKLPRWLAVAFPILVLDLPQVAVYFGHTATTGSLSTALIASLALLVPGVAEAELTPQQVTAAKKKKLRKPIHAAASV